MQLFSIGTTLLNNNGTVALDDDGRSMLSYTNEDIAEVSQAFDYTNEQVLSYLSLLEYYYSFF